VHLDCIGGLAGDMLLGALVDAGAPREALLELPDRLRLRGVTIGLERVERHGVGALHVAVEAPPDDVPRGLAELESIVDAADLSPEAAARSRATLRRIAAAEAKIHGTLPETVHFHELGALDTIVDICGAVVLLEELAVTRVACSPLPVARGFTRAAHGVLPLPAPATLELLAGTGAVLVDCGEGDELVTPTGAALAATLVETWESLPPLRPSSVGYGAGTRDTPDRPNLLRAVVGTLADAAPRPVVLLETNLDDLSPELLPDAAARCFAAGAVDVWTVPAQMKKGRPGFVLAALARPGDEAAVAEAMLLETSALGVRAAPYARYELAREQRIVPVPGGEVRVKLGYLDGRLVNVAPEHDDCAEVARRTGNPVKVVWAAALSAAQGAE
jgi:uncharacterized protein (TIGR00299 family) protein